MPVSPPIPHDDLIRRRDGLYARLWSLQTDQVDA